MEGIGSRLGRVSSRYNAGSAPVFDGPVRKWKKQWVLYQSDNNNVSGAGKGNNRRQHHQKNPPPILLCRWTPLPSSTTTAVDDSVKPPKRKFRYTPVVVLEEKKKEAIKKVGNEAEASLAARRDVSFKKPHFSDAFMEEELSEDEEYFNGDQLDLQL